MIKEQEWISLAKKLATGAKGNAKANKTILRLDGKTGRKKHLDVAITWEDVYPLLIDQKFKCALSGMDLVPGYGKSGHPLYASRHPLAPSLDRINDDIGYRKDNVRIILRLLNLGLSAYKGDEGVVLKALGLSS